MSAGKLSLRKATTKSYGYTPVTQIIAGSGDPYWNNVSLLLLGNGPNGGNNNTDVDSSPNNTALTRVGSPTIGAVGPYPGFNSVLFPTSSDALRFPASPAAMAVGSGDFTCEAWIYPFNRSGTQIVFGGQSDGNTAAGSSWFGAISTTAVTSDLYVGSVAYSVACPNPLANTWSHVCFMRSGSSWISFLNGVVVGSVACSGSVNVGATSTLGTIGATGARAFLGYISGLRIVKSAVYSASGFTPPTTPPTAIANTSLLCNFDTAAVVDSARLNNVATAGGMALSSVTTKYGTASLAFNGTNAAALTTDSTLFEFGSGDFTIDMWVNTAQTTQYATLVSRSPAAWGTGMWTLVINNTASSGSVAFWAWNQSTATAVVETAGASVIDGLWHHVALVRFGNVLTIYIDGLIRGTAAMTATIADIAAGPVIGGDTFAGRFFNGYIDDLRITKGVARYKGNFQPPLSELPGFYGTPTTDDYWNATTLLLHGDGANNANNATILDSSTNNFTITKVGTPAQGSVTPFPVPGNTGRTYVASVNGGSCYFNGTTDALTVSDNANLELGASNFAIEFWINTTATAQYTTIVSRMPAVFAAGMWTLQVNSNGVSSGDVAFWSYDYNAGGGQLVVSTGVNVIDGVWHHVALTRSGSTWTIWVDGISRGTGTAAVTIADIAGGVYIGADQNYVRRFSGYLSNLRIVKGDAVYTAPFTPSAVPLTPVANTSLLLGFNNAAIVDQTCKTNLKVSGNPATMVAVNKFGGSSIYFDGLSTSFLTLPASSNFNLNSMDWTIECWLYLLATPASPVGCIVQSTTGGGGWIPDLYVGVRSTGFYAVGAGQVESISTTSATLNTWAHVAAVRSGTTVKLYINGAATSINATLNATASNLSLYVGKFDGTPGAAGVVGLNCYVDDLRITKGVARYTGNFIPSTAALPDK